MSPEEGGSSGKGMWGKTEQPGERRHLVGGGEGAAEGHG